MKKEIKERLENLVNLLNDPDAIVVEKELREKLVVILELLDHPEDITKEKMNIKDKLETVLKLVHSTRVDPDIEVEYHIPKSEDPYILVKYIPGERDERRRKIRLRDSAIRMNTPEDLTKQITFSIKEFKGEIDSVEMG